MYITIYVYIYICMYVHKYVYIRDRRKGPFFALGHFCLRGPS